MRHAVHPDVLTSTHPWKVRTGLDLGALYRLYHGLYKLRVWGLRFRVYIVWGFWSIMNIFSRIAPRGMRNGFPRLSLDKPNNHLAEGFRKDFSWGPSVDSGEQCGDFLAI